MNIQAGNISNVGKTLASQVGVCTIDLETVQENLAILLLTIR